MPVRRLACLVALLMSLDFSTPYIGGAFTFESSEEGVSDHRQQERTRPFISRTPLPPSLPTEPPGRAVLGPTRPPRSGLQQSGLALPRALAQADAPAAPSEEH